MRCSPRQRRFQDSTEPGAAQKIQSPSSSLIATKEALQKDIEDLRQKKSVLDKETQQLMAEGYSIEELDEHISLLHEYNDLKDAGQLLMGKLAVLRGVTTKDLYKELDLDLED